MGGIDLSQTTDLTAASVVIQKDGTLYAFTQFFMPRGRLEYLQATDGVPYDIFVKGADNLKRRELRRLPRRLRLVYYVTGRLRNTTFKNRLRQIQRPVPYYRYGKLWFSHGRRLPRRKPYTSYKEFEGIIKDGDFKIADNNLLKTHFLNVALKHNMETRKFRPIKIEQRAHIDGFVSVIDAMTVQQKYWEECGELLKNAA